jgi:flagellar protein FlbD
MIRLTRLNRQPMIVNSDLIKFVEQSPDTLITLITGEKIVVQETPDEVLALLISFRRSVLQGLSLTWDSSWDSSAAHILPPRPAETGRREPGK